MWLRKIDQNLFIGLFFSAAWLYTPNSTPGLQKCFVFVFELEYATGVKFK